MNHKIDWENNGVKVSVTGNVTFEEVFQTDGMIYGDSRFSTLKYVIYDLSEVTSLNLNTNDLKMISTLDKSASRWNEKLKLSLLVKGNETKVSLKKYISFMKDSGWDIRIFNNNDDVLNWSK
jgi:hypothetical protein